MVGGPRAWEEVAAEEVRNFWLHPPDPLAVMLAEKLRRGASVLDVGCGAGRHLHFFRDRGFSVIGIDPSPGQRQAAQKAMPDVPVYPLSFDEAFPFADGRFDAVLSTYAIYHGRRKMVHWVIGEALRVLRLGGDIHMHLISTRDFKWGVGSELEKNTYAEVRPGEFGTMHHFFDLEEVIDVFKPLSELYIAHEERPVDPGPKIHSVAAFDRVCAHWMVTGVK